MFFGYVKGDRGTLRPLAKMATEYSFILKTAMSISHQMCVIGDFC